MSFFSRKSSTSTELIFDIESDSVCVSMVIYEAGKTPRIVYVNSTEIVQKSHTNGAYLTQCMLKSLEAAAKTASSAVPDLIKNKIIERARFDKTHFVLSSPWIISKLSSIQKNFEKDTVIKQAAVASLIEKEKDEIANLFAAGDSMAVDTKLFEIKLNGYPVAEYRNKRAKSIQGTFIVSFASRKTANDMRSAVGRFFRADSESFHSATLLRYVSLRSVLPHHGHLLWIQVHGELTDVCLVRDGICVMNGSLPFGSNTLIRKFAASTKENDATSASLLEFLDNGSNTVLSLQKTRSALDSILPEWANGINSLMGDKEGITPVSTAYVSASRFGFAFNEALKKLSPSTSIKTSDPSMMAPFIEYGQSAFPDLSSSLYAAALPMSEKL